MSALPSPVDAGGLRPLRLVAAVAWAASVWMLSSMSDPPGTDLVAFPFQDKVAHLGLFFVQAGLLRFAGLRAPWAVAIAVSLGAVDELHQAFVPDRSPDLVDLAADAVGAALGAAAVGWSARRARRAR